jgi:hypothetical protein
MKAPLRYCTLEQKHTRKLQQDYTDESNTSVLFCSFLKKLEIQQLGYFYVVPS